MTSLYVRLTIKLPLMLLKPSKSTTLVSSVLLSLLMKLVLKVRKKHFIIVRAQKKRSFGRVFYISHPACCLLCSCCCNNREREKFNLIILFKKLYRIQTQEDVEVS